MFLSEDIPTTFGRLQPPESCVDVPLVLLDQQLAALNQRAQSEGRTIGQMIRLAIGLHLAHGCGCCESGWGLGNPRIESPPDCPGIFEVSLLLPSSRVGELEVLAFRCETTTASLIRRMVCCSLLECSSIQLPREVVKDASGRPMFVSLVTNT